MIANVNEKGRQTKLLAAIAVLAMVVCAFAVVMPSEDVSGMSEPVTSETGVTNLGTTSTTLTNNGECCVLCASGSPSILSNKIEGGAGTKFGIYICN